MTTTVDESAGPLRERKKRQTRELIAGVATQLFIANGFETTTIAEVARAADVAKMTVTNYFPLKEDLVFDQAETIVQMLADAVTTRPRGTSALTAARQAYDAALDRRDPTLGFLGAPFAELIMGSPALLARERAMFAAQEAALAAVLEKHATSPADLRPRLAAAQLASIVRILYYEGRRRLLGGESTDAIVRALRRAARTAFDTLQPALPTSLTTG
jgi:AcrR family transcriptional regulator